MFSHPFNISDVLNGTVEEQEERYAREHEEIARREREQQNNEADQAD